MSFQLQHTIAHVHGTNTVSRLTEARLPSGERGLCLELLMGVQISSQAKRQEAS